MKEKTKQMQKILQNSNGEVKKTGDCFFICFMVYVYISHVCWPIVCKPINEGPRGMFQKSKNRKNVAVVC